MKSEREIQKAHDILVAILTGDVPSPFQNRHAHTALRECASVLCWILGHEHNKAFAENLAFIDERLAAMGYQLIDSGEVRTREDFP